MNCAMDDDPTSLVLWRLEERGFDPRPTGQDQYESRCPGHDGGRKNLSIASGDDGVCLIHCHHEPGCSAQSITEALGLSLADLFPRDETLTRQNESASNKPRPRAYKTPTLAPLTGTGKFDQPSCSWIYPSLDGNVLLRVNRFDYTDPDTGKPAKTYRPQHLTSEGWRSGDPPGPLPLYRVTDLPNAETIHVCDGEKVAEEVRKLRLIATTSAHGAGSPHKSDWTVLAGKKVVILPDHDQPGEAYGRKVLDLLGKLDPHPTVKVVDLPKLWPSGSPIPEGADMADWVELPLSQGATLEECKKFLEAVVTSTPEPDLGEARTQADAPSLSTSGTLSESIEDLPNVVPQWPSPVAEEALCGLAGEVIRLIEPNSSVVS